MLRVQGRRYRMETLQLSHNHPAKLASAGTRLPVTQEVTPGLGKSLTHWWDGGLRGKEACILGHRHRRKWNSKKIKIHANMLEFHFHF